MQLDAHRIAELRSLAYHREVARRLPTRQDLIDGAQAQVERGLHDPRAAPWLAEWQQLLDGPRDALLAVLTTDDERCRALRQCTPFAGALTARERWSLWKSVRREAERGEPAGART